MGSAYVRGFIAREAYAAADIIVSDVRAEALAALHDELGVETTQDNQALVDSAEVLLLAIKPQVLEAVLRPLRLREGQLLISIAAGVSLARLASLVGHEHPVVRVMPNVLATVFQASSAYAGNAAATAEQLALVKRLLSLVGEAVSVEEKLLDAVTGLSGSGPAFVAIFAEALIEGGILAGLPRSEAAQLTARMLVGVGEWLLATGRTPAALKELVTSPGGTTIAGVRALEEGGLRAATMAAVDAAAKRSRELGG